MALPLYEQGCSDLMRLYILPNIAQLACGRAGRGTGALDRCCRAGCKVCVTGASVCLAPHMFAHVQNAGCRVIAFKYNKGETNG